MSYRSRSYSYPHPSADHRYAPLARLSPQHDDSSHSSSSSMRRGEAVSRSRDGAAMELAEREADEAAAADLHSRHAAAAASRGKSLWTRLTDSLANKPAYRERTVFFNGGASALDSASAASTAALAAAASAAGASGATCDPPLRSFPANVVRNQKYHLLTFLPHFLYEQFSFFFNFYFLIVALSQFIPALQIGFLFTYVAPLLFVLAITLTKEAVDDMARWRRDREANGQKYQRMRRRRSDEAVAPAGEDSVIEEIPASAIRVGDILILHTNQRVPADMLLLRTHDRANGSIFIRTDQLDGETDWKLRNAVRHTQALRSDSDILAMRATIQLEAPRKAIYEFAANFTSVAEQHEAGGAAALSSTEAHQQPESISESLSLDHTLWANTVVASGTVVAVVIYSGKETRSVMNANQPTTKIGALDSELNSLSKLLFVLTMILAFVMTALKGLEGLWVIQFFRFVLLFSSIIPISMRVNLDMSKTLCSWLIERDHNIPETLVRNSTIPEELGRISFLFTDKTGTLTRNIMHFKCLQLEPPHFYTRNTLPALKASLLASFVRERNRKQKELGIEPHDGSAVVVASLSSPSALDSSSVSLSPPSSSAKLLPANNASGFDRALSDDAPPSPSQTRRGKARRHSPLSPALLDIDLEASDAASSSGVAATPAPASTSKLQRMSTRLRLEAELREEDEAEDAAAVTGIAGAMTEEESESDLAEHGSFIDANSISKQHAQRHKLKISSAVTGSARAAPRLNNRGGYNNLHHAHAAGGAQGDEDDDEDEEDGVEMARLASINAAAAATNATSRRMGASPKAEAAVGGQLGMEGGEDQAISSPSPDDDDPAASAAGGASSERVEAMVRALVTSLAICHNVTPTYDEDTGATTYQAASPDEVALVKFTESVGLTLKQRTQNTITLETPLFALDNGSSDLRGALAGRSSSVSVPAAMHVEEYDVLHIFPFTSESKRMGIIVRSRLTHAITFYLKGAESIMKSKITHSDWLEEEVDNLARVGLRTLVIACKGLSEAEYSEFARRLHSAQSILLDRDAHIAVVLHALEKNLTLLGLTGVEDKLQEAVKPTLETLRNAGISLWMLTGDKAETATCIGISARLIDRNQPIYQFLNCQTMRETARNLDLFGSKLNTCLVIDGPSLQICLDSFQKLFLELSCQSPAVICCRCSPTQKATVVELMRAHTGKRTAAIGDGGNDVSMILAADVGIGIVGKEGMQASLSADFSITQFSHVAPLFLSHGRNAYIRSARLSQFVIHRGLIISIIQAVFSALFFFTTVPIYSGWLMVGYATFYTMLPVFSLVLDIDVDEQKVFLYPELYRELQKGRPLSYKTFYIWLFQSVYQGGCIMILVLLLFEAHFLNIVAITFSSLIASELLNVALEIHTWHRLMVAAEFGSVIVYIASLFLLPEYFDLDFIFTWPFAWKVALITTVSCLPPAVVKYLHGKYNPSAQSKVNQS